MSEGVSDSRFYMWRTLFAVAHADRVLTDEEIRFMVETLEDIPFSGQQRTVLEDDIRTPKDVMEMFVRVTDQKDQAEFFDLARELVWIDGDYGSEEQEAMLRLKKKHIGEVNVDNLVGSVEKKFEGER